MLLVPIIRITVEVVVVAILSLVVFKNKTSTGYRE